MMHREPARLSSAKAMADMSALVCGNLLGQKLILNYCEILAQICLCCCDAWKLCVRIIADTSDALCAAVKCCTESGCLGEIAARLSNHRSKLRLHIKVSIMLNDANVSSCLWGKRNLLV